MWDALFQGNAVWFGVPAVAGTGLFLVKLLLMLMGHHGGDGFDVHDGDVGDAVHAHDGSDAAFKLLTVQGVLGFMMGFGWTGLGLLQGTDWKLAGVIGAATAVGMVTMYVMGAVMSSMMQLQSSGNIDINKTVGAEGTVYVGVPGENAGSGQVMLVIDERQRTYDAVTAGTALPRNARVRVIAVTGQNTLNVLPV